MPRQMPKAGFYVRPKIIVITIHGEVLPPFDEEILYTTGIRGGGGHKYCRDMRRPNDPPCGCPNDHDPLTSPMEQWATLLWSCVPGKKELEEDYTYAETLEEARELYATLPYKR